MEQSYSSETNSHSASQEITRLLCKPKVHYHAHRSAPLFIILNQINPVHSFTPCFFKIRGKCQ